MAEQPSTLEITDLGPMRVATVDGDVDMATADDFERALFKLLEGTDLIVDLARCDFLDSAGLRALVSASREAARLRRRIVIARPSPGVAKLLDLTAISDAIETYDGLDSAERALRAAPPPSRG